MRIWLVNHYATPPTIAGGTRHYNFAKQLQERGHEVLIISANYNHFSHTFMQPKDKVGRLDMSFGVPFVWLPVPAYKGNTIGRFWNMLVFAWQIYKNKLLRTLPKPDVIIGSSPHLFAALSAEFLAKKFKKPFVLEIRDLWPESLVDLGRFTNRHPLIKLMKKIEIYLYRKSDRIISLLPNVNNYLSQYNINSNNICWLPNSVDFSMLPVDQVIDSANDKFIAMYAGAHGVANDLDTIIYAAKILQDKGLGEKIEIQLIGQGPEKKRLIQLAALENIKIVKFLDAVPKKQIYSVLNKADAFLMLLKKSPVFRWGISPNKLFDYLSIGRPIIFGVETTFDPVKEAKAGVSINSSDPEDLASAIYQLSLLPKAELSAMGKRGKEYVLKHHDIIKLTDSLEKLLYEVTCMTPQELAVVD